MSKQVQTNRSQSANVGFSRIDFYELVRKAVNSPYQPPPAPRKAEASADLNPAGCNEKRIRPGKIGDTSG